MIFLGVWAAAALQAVPMSHVEAESRAVKAIDFHGAKKIGADVSIPIQVDAAMFKLLARKSGDGTLREAAAAADLKLGPDDIAVLKPAAPQRLEKTAGSNTRFSSTRLLYKNAAGAAAPVASVKLAFAFRADPLPWSAPDSAFASELLLWLEGDAAAPPPHPVSLVLAGRGAGVSVNPVQLSLDKVGAAAMKTVRVAVTGAGEKPQIAVLGDLGEHVADVALDRGLAKIQISPQKPAIYGFGLESDPISIELRAADGRPFTAAAATPIRISGAHAGFPPMIEIAAGASSATAALRSAGVGTVTLTAEGAGLSSAKADIAFVWPWTLFAAELLGAAVGTFLSLKSDASRKAWIAAWLVRTAIAFLVVTAALLGVTSAVTLEVDLLLTEAGAFLAALVAAYVGRPLLDKVVGSIAPTK